MFWIKIFKGITLVAFCRQSHEVVVNVLEKSDEFMLKFSSISQGVLR